MTDAAALPATMRAVVLTGHGGLDKLEPRQDWPVPRPGPGAVVVKVGAAGLNNTDINTRTAWYSDRVADGITHAGATGGFAEADAEKGSWGGRALSFPRIQGADVAGEIAAVGVGVERARIGERVLIDPWILPDGDWRDAARASYLGSEIDGGFAEYVAVPEGNAHAIESPLSDAELATFPCAATTAETLVARTALQPGETVVISGASGGVGTIATQLCRLRGARVIAIASPAKAEALRALGADAVIDRDAPDLEAAIRAAAGGPVEAALDVVGGALFAPLIGALAQGGRYATSGAIAGPEVRFNLRELIYKDLQMTGATIVPPGTMARLARLIERGRLRPMLAETYPLAELARAQEAFAAKRHTGSIVVLP